MQGDLRELARATKAPAKRSTPSNRVSGKIRHEVDIRPRSLLLRALLLLLAIALVVGILIGVGILGLGWWGGSKAVSALNDLEQTMQAAEDEWLATMNRVRDAKPAAFTDATRIASEYDRNEVAGDVAYKGKIVAVTGFITSIHAGSSGEAVVGLSTEHDRFTIACEFQESENAGIAAMNVGDPVRLVGIGGGIDYSDTITFEHCALK